MEKVRVANETTESAKLQLREAKGKGKKFQKTERQKPRETTREKKERRKRRRKTGSATARNSDREN